MNTRIPASLELSIFIQCFPEFVGRLQQKALTVSQDYPSYDGRVLRAAPTLGLEGAAYQVSVYRAFQSDGSLQGIGERYVPVPQASEAHLKSVTIIATEDDEGCQRSVERCGRREHHSAAPLAKHR